VQTFNTTTSLEASASRLGAWLHRQNGQGFFENVRAWTMMLDK